MAALDGGEVTEELANVLLEMCVPSFLPLPHIAPYPGADSRILSCRSGASDLPQIAALLGGLVAQESIKLITKQYIPLNGTSIFNGIRSTTGIVVA